MIDELRLRATQETISARIGRTSKRVIAEHAHAAAELNNLANDLENNFERM